MADVTASVAALAEGVAVGDRTAVAAALNLVEDSRAKARADVTALLAALRAGGTIERGHRVGVTGPPGVGKSTLVAAMARAYRRGVGESPAQTLGVLAIDPMSARSGGALLGDRTRIAPDPMDHGLFVRSLSTAGELGGLAPSVPLGVRVLGAAFDVAMVETVGIGQSETDVRQIVDTLLFVVQPGSGDALQYMKAGIMEVPDVLVVNKGDQVELARRTSLELRAALASLRAAGIATREVPLVTTSAQDGTGVEELVAVLRAHHAELSSTGELVRRRREGAIACAMHAFVRRYGEVGVERAGGDRGLRDAIATRIDRGDEVIAIVEALG